MVVATVLSSYTISLFCSKNWVVYFLWYFFCDGCMISFEEWVLIRWLDTIQNLFRFVSKNPEFCHRRCNMVEKGMLESYYRSVYVDDGALKVVCFSLQTFHILYKVLDLDSWFFVIAPCIWVYGCTYWCSLIVEDCVVPVNPLDRFVMCSQLIVGEGFWATTWKRVSWNSLCFVWKSEISAVMVVFDVGVIDVV